MIVGVDAPADSDWKISTIGWVFSLALFFLGMSAALFGKWVERVGPRKTMMVSALCFSGGFFVSALGVYMHNLWIFLLGNGVLGGIGLGLGYISPVSTLIKWFPDRPGMATGMAIMGFGGGAMIASPLSQFLMDTFSSSTSVGVAEAFMCLGGIYLMFMMFGMLTVRVPAPGWKPGGFDPSAQKKNKLITTAHVTADNAIKTPQFYLLFAVLMLNVTAGIGVLGQAKLMIKEMFYGNETNAEIVTAASVGFVGFLSVFNLGGRFVWASLSDKLGRKNTYTTFFLLGAVMYYLVQYSGQIGSIGLFAVVCAIAMTIYGGGFATVPAYLRDLFGTMNVGAIHGRLLLAWSMAALIGPSLVNYIREYQINEMGVDKADAYSMTMYILVGLLLVGLLCNLLIKPVDPKFHFQGKLPDEIHPSH